VRRVRVDFAVDDSDRAAVALLDRLVDPNTQQLVSEDIVVDLSDCNFLGPTAVVTLCGLRRLAQEGGRTFSVEPPRLRKLLAYCGYSGLLSEFGVGPGPAAHPENVTTPIRVFTEQLPEDAIREIVSLARQEMTLSVAAEDDLKSVLSELTQNVLDHSASPIGGLVTARAYKKEREVRLAVADMGIGIRESLTRRHQVKGDREAIRQALVAEVSGRSSSRNLGLGLAHLHGVVRITGGRMVIYSGRGVFWHEAGRDHDRDVPCAYPGTVVFVRLPARVADGEGLSLVDIWE
jgi:signal transduction histidine kinase